MGVGVGGGSVVGIGQAGALAPEGYGYPHEGFAFYA